jgi:hypothetical protein
VDLLLTAGADVYQADATGWSALACRAVEEASTRSAAGSAEL